MQIMISLLQYAAAFLLGLLVTVWLCGIPRDTLQKRTVMLICAVLLMVQLISALVLGIETTKKIYPLIVHVLLWALLVVILQTPKLQTAASVLVAYMCCQPVRWVASLGMYLPQDHWLYCVLYLPAAGIWLYIIGRWIAPPMKRFLERSRQACILMVFLPALYYIFDYVTTVYTDLLISGNNMAVQFMPSVISGAYLLFVVLYDKELEKQLASERERDLMAILLRQSGQTIDNMQRQQERTKLYRHDMRHHFALLNAFAAENNMDKIRQYLSAVQEDMEALTPRDYCKNEIVNLVLSYYAAQAGEEGIAYRVTAMLPARLPCSETELCAVLSNGLENAIQAASLADPEDHPSVTVHMGLQGENLLIQIRNTCIAQLRWKDGLPCTDREDHGYGTRSIRTIARSRGGDAVFSFDGGFFQLRILLPAGE